MKTLNLLALTASALITLTGLAAMNSPARIAPVSQINGVQVIDLAPVSVSPSAEELRAAAVPSDAAVASAIVMPVLTRGSASGASLLGAQLAMPYYSFGSKLGRVSKE
jgi:hypothetical protein